MWRLALPGRRNCMLVRFELCEAVGLLRCALRRWRRRVERIDRPLILPRVHGDGSSTRRPASRTLLTRVGEISICW